MATMAGPFNFANVPPLLFPGRIDRKAFEVSLGVLLGVTWIAAAIRFYVRIGIQKAVSIDDGFLVAGLFSLTASFGVIFGNLDTVYIEESFLMGQSTLAFLPGFLQSSLDFLKTSDIALILAWISICSVKFSFLFLFRKLVDRLHNLMVYWWIVFSFVLVTSIYGTFVYILMCPYVGSPKALMCTTPTGIMRIKAVGHSQIVVDFLGDALILAIPVRLLWKIKIGTKQKFWLGTSLCLTVVMIAMTIIRIAGETTPSGNLDTAWETYWNLVSAEVGLIMTSATAFRTLYMSKTSTQNQKRTLDSSGSWASTLIRSSKLFLIKAVHPRSWTTRNSSNPPRSYDLTNDSDTSNSSKELKRVELRGVPRAHMTGLHTVISNAGQDLESLSAVDTLQSHWEEETEKPVEINK